MNKFLSRLKSAKIFEVASIYAATAWITIQVLATTSPFIGIPKVLVTSVIFTLLALFPIFLIQQYSKAFELKAIEKGSEAQYVHSKSVDHFFQQINLLDSKIWPRFLVVISIFLLSFAWSKKKPSPEQEKDKIVLQDKLAVLYFENQTGDQELDVIGPMISHWLTEGFIENGDIKIVSANTVQRAYQSHSIDGGNMQSKDFSTILGTKNVIDGSYFLQHDSIFLKANLTNVESGDVVYTFGDFAGLKDEPIKIIEDLREKVLGYWYNKSNLKRYPAPRYDSYKKYLEAQLIWSEDKAKVKALLDESIALDPSFYEPQFLQVALHRNDRKWSVCDSIINKLYSIKTNLTEAQLDKLKFFRYEMQGDYVSAYSYLKKEFDRDPEDLFINTSLMNFVNKKLSAPNLCLDIAKHIPIDSLDFEDCNYCQTRLYNLSLANLNAGNLQSLPKLFKLNSSINTSNKIKQIEVLYLVKSKKDKLLEDLLFESKMRNNTKNYLDLTLVAAVEYLRHNSPQKSKKILNDFSSSITQIDSSSLSSQELLAQYYEMLGEYEKAKSIYLKLEKKYPGDIYYGFRVACIHAYNNEIEKAINLANHLEASKRDHDFGYVEYEMARVHSILGYQDKAIDYLQKSVLFGRQFHVLFFERDYYLKSLWGNQKLQSIINSRKIPKG